jgi:endonuclease YncB( thermonuclease family)
MLMRRLAITVATACFAGLWVSGTLGAITRTAKAPGPAKEDPALTRTVCELVRVTDGDTIVCAESVLSLTASPDPEVPDAIVFGFAEEIITHRVRLAAIDAPETNLTRSRWVGCCYGAESAARLRLALPRGAVLRLLVTATDRYGRLVAYVWTGSGRLDPRTSINWRTVREGSARFYAAYPGLWAGLFAAAERRANTQRRGLWGSPCA